MCDLRVGPPRRDPEPRSRNPRARVAPEDAPPRRQRRRRGRRLRPAGRHPNQDLGRGGPPGRTQPLARAGRRVRGRSRLRRALTGPGEGPPRRQGAARQGGLPHPRRAGRRRRFRGPRPDRPRGGAAVLAVRRPGAGGRRCRSSPLQPEGRPRGEARRPRGLVLRADLRLQGDGQPEGPRLLLRRSLRRARRDDRLLRPQPLFDQHLAVVHPGPALRRPRAQRRDQHDRAAPPGGADAERPDRRRELGFAGPEPDDRDAGAAPRPLTGRGDGDGRSADRRRDRRPARGAPPLLHVPAPDDGPVRAGPGRADRPPPGRVRVLGGRDGLAAALAARDRPRLHLQLGARGRPGGRDDLRAEADGAGREVPGADRPRPQALDAPSTRRDAAPRAR